MYVTKVAYIKMKQTLDISLINILSSIKKIAPKFLSVGEALWLPRRIYLWKDM